MELFQCAPHEIDRAWSDGADRLAEATKWAAREVTACQLKMLLSRGERTLLGAREGDKVLGWAAVGVQQLPNLRVLHVYGAAGEGICAPEVVGLLREYARANGCTTIRACVRPSMTRLLRHFGAQPIYTTVELEV